MLRRVDSVDIAADDIISFGEVISGWRFKACARSTFVTYVYSKVSIFTVFYVCLWGRTSYILSI